MTENSAPSAKGRRTSKKSRALESRTQRLADTIRRHRSDTTARLDLLESWILDLCVYLNIEISQLLEVVGKEEST